MVKSDVQVLTTPLRTKTHHKMYLAKQAVSDKLFFTLCPVQEIDFSSLDCFFSFVSVENWALDLLHLASH